MKATVKLNPVRLIVPKYNNAPFLLMEKIAGNGMVGIQITDKGEYFEVILPLTKQSIIPYKNYINDNLSIEE
jgi:hypothetical protein